MARKSLLERLFEPLFHRDITYNNQYPSFLDKLSPNHRLDFNSYLQYIKVNQDRKMAYKEYEQMDTDLISSALDLWADDATQMNLEDGESFYVVSDDAEIKSILEELFFQTLHIEDQLWNIVRTTAKYGDYFIRVAGEDSKGIKYCDFSYHPSRITRIDYHGEIKQFIVDEAVACNAWDFVHFKFPGSVQFPDEGTYEYATSKDSLNRFENQYTYGQSAIAKARKVWKQLNLLENSLVLSRLSRSFKRNVFSVNTTGLGETAAWDLVDKVSSLLKRNKAINEGQGMESISGLMNPEEDIVLPVSGEKGTLNVQELGGDVDIQHIADVDYLNNKLFAALKTPKAYLGFEESLNGRNTLRMLDVRYARTIKNLQRVLVLGLERIARIHLSLLKRDPFGTDFRIILPYISTIEESEKTEAMSNKLDSLTKVISLLDQIDAEKEFINKPEMIHYMMIQLGIDEEKINKIIDKK